MNPLPGQQPMNGTLTRPAQQPGGGGAPFMVGRIGAALGNAGDRIKSMGSPMFSGLANALIGNPLRPQMAQQAPSMTLGPRINIPAGTPRAPLVQGQSIGGGAAPRGFNDFTGQVANAIRACQPIGMT